MNRNALENHSNQRVISPPIAPLPQLSKTLKRHHMLIARIFSVLFPILTIVIVGYLYARIRQIDMSTANRLNMEVFTPALLFTVLSDNTFNIMDYQQLGLATILMILGSGIIVFPLIQRLEINPKTFIPSMMFVNAGNMGIPVALFAFGEVGLPAAMLFLMTTALLNFTLGISLVSQRASLFALLKMPLIQATLLGLLISLSSIEVPSLLSTPIKMLGTCAIPVMLLSLGVRLSDIDLTHWRIGLLGAVLRPLSGGIMFLIIQPWFTLTPLQTNGLLLLKS